MLHLTTSNYLATGPLSVYGRLRTHALSWRTEAKTMKKMFLSFGLLLLAVPLRASCPVTLKCDLDGQYMSEEETYVNGMHVSKKYGHDYYGPNGTVHHYVIVKCD